VKDVAVYESATENTAPAKTAGSLKTLLLPHAAHHFRRGTLSGCGVSPQTTMQGTAGIATSGQPWALHYRLSARTVEDPGDNRILHLQRRRDEDYCFFCRAYLVRPALTSSAVMCFNIIKTFRRNGLNGATAQCTRFRHQLFRGETGLVSDRKGNAGARPGHGVCTFFLPPEGKVQTLEPAYGRLRTSITFELSDIRHGHPRTGAPPAGLETSATLTKSLYRIVGRLGDVSFRDHNVIHSC
jgi:hypothetical protein